MRRKDFIRGFLSALPLVALASGAHAQSVGAAASSTVIASRTVLAAYSGSTVYLAESGRQGWFSWSGANNATNVTNDPQQGLYVPPTSDTTGASGAWVRIAPAGQVYAEWFGAVGDDSTDCTAAIQAAVTYGLTLNVCKIKFGAGIFRFTNIVFPTYQSASNGFKVIHFEGVAEPSATYGSVGSFTLNPGGTILKSLATTGSYAISVASPAFSNYMLVFTNIAGRLYPNPQIGFLSAAFAQQLVCDHVNIDCGAYDVNITQPTNSSVVGIVTPIVNNGALNWLHDVTLTGMYTALQANEHTNGDGVNIAGVIQGIQFPAAFHASRFGRVLFAQTQKPVVVTGVCRFSIAQMDVEHDTNGAAWQQTTFDIVDASNLGVGEITYAVVKGGVGIDHTWTVSGATGIIQKEIGTAGAF